MDIPERHPEDLRRDARDRPAQVLDFLGVAPGMQVLDFNAATGYYTELLAGRVGPRGRVIAHHHPGARVMLGVAALSARYAGGRLPNVEQLVARDVLGLHPQSLDMILLSMSYHDAYWHDPRVDWGPVDRPELLRQFHEALRPGGIVGVIDHVAEAGADPAESVMALHRIDPQIVRRDFLQAGFVAEAESAVLRNPDDDHRLDVFDPVVHGRTDRFVMRFRQKPSSGRR